MRNNESENRLNVIGATAPPEPPSLGINPKTGLPISTEQKTQEFPTRIEIEREALETLPETHPDVPYESRQPIQYQETVNYSSIRHEVNRPKLEVVQREVVIVESPVYFGYVDPYPVLPSGIAWLIFIINLLLPGIGTMIVACLGVDNPGYFILNGLFQLVTCFFIVGYVMAIWTSCILIMKSR